MTTDESARDGDQSNRIEYEEHRVTDENLLDGSATTSMLLVNPPPELLASSFAEGNTNNTGQNLSNNRVRQGSTISDFNDRESVGSPPNQDMNGELMID
jgi:hypothetical protein